MYQTYRASAAPSENAKAKATQESNDASKNRAELASGQIWHPRDGVARRRRK